MSRTLFLFAAALCCMPARAAFRHDRDQGGCPQAGTDAVVQLCTSGLSFFLSTGGDAGGTWLGPDNVPVSPLFVPGVSAPGCYRYVVTGEAPCPNDTAQVCVNVVAPPNAGNDSVIVLCASDAPIILDTGGDPGGTWTDPFGAVVDAVFDPATDPAGCYIYWVSALPPCADQEAVLCIVVTAPPDPGVDTEVTLCQDGPSLPLTELLDGDPDANGVWALDGTPVDPVFTPGEDLPTCYTYTVPGQAPCASRTSTVCISYGVPSAGPDADLSLCTNDAPLDLYDALLIADTIGYWTDTEGQVFDGIFDPATRPSGAYMYHVEVGPFCSDEATVFVTVWPAPWAGIGGTETICINAGATSLFGLLEDDPDLGGTWVAPNGAPYSGVFDPEKDQEGCYTYTVSGEGLCPDATASICVEVISCSVGITEVDRSMRIRSVGGDALHPSFVIELPEAGPLTWSVFDAAGRSLTSGSVATAAQRHTLGLDLAGHAAGVYTLRAIGGSAAASVRFVR